MWQIIIALIALILVLAIVIETLSFVYGILSAVWPITLISLLILSGWYGKRFYKRNATVPRLEDRIKDLQQEYQVIFDEIGSEISLTNKEIPSTRSIKYLYISPNSVGDRVARLEESLNLYQEYLQLTEQVGRTELANLITDFEPQSYDSNETFQMDIKRLSTVVNCYRRYADLKNKKDLQRHFDERNFDLPIPESMAQLEYKIEPIKCLTELFETYVEALESYCQLTDQESSFGELQTSIDRELLAIEGVDDMRNTTDKLRQLGRLFTTHNQLSKTDEIEMPYETTEIVAFADSMYTKKYTQSTKRSIDAYRGYLKTIEQISGGRYSGLDNSIIADLQRLLESSDPLGAPQEATTVYSIITETADLFQQIRQIDNELLVPEVNTIQLELLEELDSGSLTKEEINEYSELIVTSHELAQFIQDNKSHPSIDTSEWQSEITQALEQRFPKRLRPLNKQRERMLDNYWEQEDLYQYDWQEFEELIGTLFQAEGYEVEVTQGTQDFGVDVYAESDNVTIAIQVKQFSEGNRVGREPLQKLASTLATGSADEVIIVTSSSFAKTASDYARDFGSEMYLIDGAELVNRLIDAEVPPPS